MNISPPDHYFLAAPCAVGLEKLLAEELCVLGGTAVQAGRGVVSARGDLTFAYRCCLWSRLASRILLQLDQFPVNDEAMLYARVREFPWEEHLDTSTSFAVEVALASGALLGHSHFAALRAKDAVVDRFRDRQGERPSVDTNRPGLRVHLYQGGDQATLSLDLSGESLHRRGYRVAGSKAPLKETLAAAIVLLAGWGKDGHFLPALIDPMCGTGTLLIEAALIYGDIAPGLSRTYYGFSGWRQHRPDIWDRLVEEALAREEAGNRKNWPFLAGYDADVQAVSAARQNVGRAGLDERIVIKQAELASLHVPRASGMLLANLPYGERLADGQLVSYLYRAYGRIARERFGGWRLAAFIGNAEMTDSFTVSWPEKYPLYNGDIACRLLVAELAQETEHSFVWQVQPAGAEERAVDFANRLRKNLKKFLAWANKTKVSCLRVYDRDLPEYNVSIDLLGKWVLIHEYAPPKSISEELAAARFQQVQKTVQNVLGLRSDRLFTRLRRRQKGKQQYEKKDSRKKFVEVQEGPCRFLINLRDYLDTGLFLDHRPLRERIFQEAKGARFLNLFGYTGTATVQAAMGGAAATTTVDLSETYLNWAKMNLAVNGFAVERHRFCQTDCLRWLGEEQNLYDLILVDPPTFSNTKKQGLLFDVQRDHVRLLQLAMQRLAPGGLLFFSTNFRSFTIDSGLAERYHLIDISRATVPFDFARHLQIHRCWELRHRLEKTR